jgi:hypothetical protein
MYSNQKKCNQPQNREHHIPQPRHYRIRCSNHTLTNPKCQPYRTYKFSENAPVKNTRVPIKYTATPADIPKIPKKITPSNTSDPSTPTTTRPMHHANVPAHRHKQYINRHRDDYRHKSNRAFILTRHKLESSRCNTNDRDIMYNVDDHNNSAATAPRERRGGRAPVDFTSTSTPKWPSHGT